MIYKITIQKFIEDEEFKAKLDEYYKNQERNKYDSWNRNNDITYPNEFKIDKALEVDLTEEEFKVIKKAVVEIM